MKKIVFTFGRYNPPTVGHAELIMYAVKLAQRTGAEHRIYTSQSHDPSKNPLAPKQKMAFLRQIFPGVNFVDDPKLKTAFAICKKLTDEGYEDVTFVVGDDRVNEFRTQLGKYVMPKTAKGFDPKKHYPFKKFQVVSSGGRKEGISGTALRAAVRKGDFATFAKASAARDKSLARKIFTATKAYLKEEKGISRKDFHDNLMSFVDFSCAHLGIKDKPTIKYKDDLKSGQPSFAAYSPGTKEVYISTKNRHPMDVFRSIAHELVHHKQNLDGRLGKNIEKEGVTGSKIENEANSEAGKIMRYFGGLNPFYFDMDYITEKAIILAGTPGSGKDKILKEAILPAGFSEINADEFHKVELQGNVVINGSFDPEKVITIKEALELKGYQTIMVFVNTSNEVSKLRNEARAGKGRVIAENVRFGKWKAAQDALNFYDSLFEKVIEVKNDLDLNQPETIIQEVYEKLIKSVAAEIDQFAMTDQDHRFHRMLNEVGGAGNWGTTQLTDRYKKDTPGQEPGPAKPMKVLTLKDKIKESKPTVARGMSSAPIGGDRIGDEAGLPKSPGFGDNQSVDLTGLDRQIDRFKIDRWMQSEETKKRFKARYGALSEQKMKETAARLAKMESLDDPFSGSMGAVSATTGNDDVRPNFGQIDQEKTSLFGQKYKSKKKKYTK